MRDAALQGLAVGFFDGVHLGHQAILKGADAALTFRNHPLTILAPEKAPRLIMTCEERIAAIKACGVKDVTVLEFTPELAEMTAAEFAQEYFLATKGHKGAQRIVCGANWRFGKGGAGDAEFLRKRGIDVEVVPYAEYKGGPVSSSRIRTALERGEIEDANAMMGRKFEVRGSSFKGKGVGKEIGFPTLNLELSTLNLQLPFGVYEVEVDGVKGIANYGLAPTMGDEAWEKPVLEIHLLGTGAEDMRRETEDGTAVLLIRYVRPEKKFDSIDDLKRQIAADCATIAT